MKIDLMIVDNQLNVKPDDLCLEYSGADPKEIRINLEELAFRIARDNGFEITDRQKEKAILDSFRDKRFENKFFEVVLSSLSTHRIVIQKNISASELPEFRKKFVKALNTLKHHILLNKSLNFNVQTEIEI
jgi:hypothetical protein